MLNLRRYTVEDRAGVRAAFREIFDNSELRYFDENLFDGPSIIGVDEDGAVQAFILVENTPEGFTECEIAYLGVAAAWRRQGLAKRLIRTVQEVMSRGGGVWLKVLEKNLAARRLYEELGFVIGERYTVEEEVGLTLVWDVAYQCSLCAMMLTPATVVWSGVGEKIRAHCRGCDDR